jgi:hypothetical protein
MIGHPIASLAKTGLDRALASNLVRSTPGASEFVGTARDAAQAVDLAAMGASRLGDVAEFVGESKQLRGLARRFEKDTRRRS